MSMSLFRRVTGLIPMAVTTSPAPPPVGGTDVAATPHRPGSLPRLDRPERALARLGVPDHSPASLPPAPPSWTPGLCYHAGHVMHDDVRYGVLPEPGPDPRLATLLRCDHVNASGQ